jgi:hypothetical protein
VLFSGYLESDKDWTTHILYGGLPLRGDLTDYVVNTTRALIMDSDTSNILKEGLGPSSARHAYSSEGGPFLATISCLCAFSHFSLFWCAL